MGRRTDHRLTSTGRRHLITPSALLLLTLVSLLLTLTGCSFDYQQSDQDDQKSVDADMVLLDSTYTILRSGTGPLVFLSRRAEFYDQSSTAILTEVSFQQFGIDGDLQSRGSCQRARIDTDSNDVLMEGDILLEALTEQTDITSQRLSWVQAEQVLESGPEDTVSVRYSDGSLVQGVGFRADMGLRTMEFLKSTQGVVIYE